MGLLYELSSTDDHHYGRGIPPEPPTTDTETDDASSLASSTEAAAAAPDWKGMDIALAGLIMVGVFFALIMAFSFVFAFVWLTRNPTAIDTTDPYAAAQQMIEPVQSAFILQFAIAGVIYALALLAASVFIGARVRWQWAKLGARQLNGQQVRYALMVGLFASLLLIGGTLFIAASSGILDALIGELDALMGRTSENVMVVALLTGVLLLPLAEELFFRGVLYTWLRRRGSVTYAVMISALLYALLNLNPVSFFASAAIGVSMALVYERTGSIWGAYLAHSTFNAVSIMLYLFALSYTA